MKDYKSISLFLIPYLTVCAVLYHLSFWGTFNLNGLSFISISDILKSAVYPVASVFFTILFQLTIQNLVFPNTSNSNTPRKVSNWTVVLGFLGIQVLLILVLYLTNSFDEPQKFIWFALIYSLFPSILLTNNGFLNSLFDNESLRRFSIDLLVFLPVFSYFAGQYQSFTIQQNFKYKYSITANKNIITNRMNSSDTIKLLGNTDKYFIFTDLKNSKILFIKSDIVDTLVLYDKK